MEIKVSKIIKCGKKVKKIAKKHEKITFLAGFCGALGEIEGKNTKNEGNLKRKNLSLSQNNSKQDEKVQKNVKKVEKTENLGEIVAFPNREKSGISEDDINMLFRGLVRLVRRSAEIDYESEREDEERRRALMQIELKRREVLLRELRAQNEALREKLREEKEKNKAVNKLEALRQFLESRQRGGVAEVKEV